MLEHFLSVHSFPLSMLLLSNSLALSYFQHRYTPNWALLFFHKVKVYLDFPLSTNFLAHFSLLHMRPFFWGGWIFLLPELKLWLSYSETALVASSRFLFIRVSFSHPHFQLSMWIRFNFFLLLSALCRIFTVLWLPWLLLTKLLLLGHSVHGKVIYFFQPSLTTVLAL